MVQTCIFHQQATNNTGRPSTAATLPAVKEVWSWWLLRWLLLHLLLRPAELTAPNPSAMAVEEEEEAGVAVVVRRGQPEEEAGQLGRIRQLKLLKGPSIEHRWLVAEEVVVAE